MRQELRAFQRKGLNKRQAQLVSELSNVARGSSILEIGCGIGAISTTLLEKGASSGHYVEISSDYLEAAREVAEGAGVSEKATFHLDDFAATKNHYAYADIVVLDRVVCCYPDGPKLITKAARHSRQHLIYTYPKPLWFIRVFKTMLGFTMRLFRQDYRFFLHDPERLLQAATEAGHVVIVTRAIGLWQLVVLSKGVNSSASSPCMDHPASSAVITAPSSSLGQRNVLLQTPRSQRSSLPPVPPGKTVTAKALTAVFVTNF